MGEEAATVLFTAEGGVGYITLNRPERMNAFDEPTAYAWREAVRSAVDDDSVVVIVVQAEGRSFCAGGDVLAMASGGVGDGGITELARVINEGIETLVGSAVPVIAAAQGSTAGGGLGILLASDYAIVAEDSRLGSLYAELGLTPDLSVTAQLARAVGERRALQLALTARMLTADEALDWGLVAEVVPVGTVRMRAGELARTLAAGAADAYGQAKRLLRSERQRSFAEQLDDEAVTIGAAAGTGEARTRIAAFAARSGRSGS